MTTLQTDAPDLVDPDADAAPADEPAQYTDRIQPHGAFLAVRSNGQPGVVAASANVADMVWGSASSSRTVIGCRLADVFSPDFAAEVQRRLQAGKLRGEAPWRSSLRRNGHDPPPGDESLLDVTVHCHASLINVELERAAPRDAADAVAAMRQLQALLVDLRDTSGSLDQLAQVATEGVRSLTGFDRVALYKFDSDWNRQAIWEDKTKDWDQTPAGSLFATASIPDRARDLYSISPMRWVPRRDAVPVQLAFDPSWTAEQIEAPTIDLSFSYLRPLSPAQLRCLRASGVNGSLSFSILYRGRLWGLMICEHRQPWHPSPGQRSAAAMLTEAFSSRIAEAEHTDARRAHRAGMARLSTVLARMTTAACVDAALAAGDVNVGDLFSCTGAALLHGGNISLLGRTPDIADIRTLAEWLKTAPSTANLYQTSNFAAAFPPWQRHQAIASGILAAFLSADRSDVLLWFRPEQPDQWRETRRAQARPWKHWELELAETLRRAITEVTLPVLHRIAALNETLRQSQKMEAVGRLTGGIAHDFNNLLGAITGSLEMLRVRANQGRFDSLIEHLEAAATAADRAASLTQRLLSFSRRQTHEATTVDVARLIGSMKELIARSLGPAIAVETVVAANIWRTRCDANQLENALLNLAINARDAMPDGGQLFIAAANIDLGVDHAGRHACLALGQYVAIRVTDTGTGIGSDVIAHVLEPFFTTKPRGQGTGLGLSMVQGFVRQFNGSIDIDSEPGHGTTVRLYLPRDVERLAGNVPPKNVPLMQPIPDAGAGTGKTVLVVDDEAVLRRLLVEMLRDLGYRVVEAASGAEALCVLRSGHKVDLLVTDIGLPGGMNGRRLADEAGVLHRGLKILFITGYAENDDVLEPNMPVITKPFPLKLLAAKIREVI